MYLKGGRWNSSIHQLWSHFHCTWLCMQKYDAWSWLIVTVVYLQLLPLYSYEREVWFQFPSARAKSSSVGTNETFRPKFSAQRHRYSPYGIFLNSFFFMGRVCFICALYFLIHGNIWLQVWEFFLARLQMLFVRGMFFIPNLSAFDRDW